MPIVAREAESAAPGPVSPTATFRFSSGDGTGLYGEWFAAQRPRATALIVHGYTEHCGRYRELANVLNRDGIAAMSYDMRGHGRANGQRGHIDSFSDYLDDLDAALDELRARVGDPAVPVLLICHSNGGLIALRALADPLRKPAGVTAAVVSSPFLGFKLPVAPAKKLVARAAGRWASRLSLPNDIPIEYLTSDPAKQAERRVDTLCHDVASARWYTETLLAHEYVADYAARVDIPTMWLVANDDQIADPAAARVVHARLRSSSTYHGLESMHHEVFNERARGRTFDLLRAFLDEILTRAA